MSESLDTRIRAFIREHNITTARAWDDLHDLIATECVDARQRGLAARDAELATARAEVERLRELIKDYDQTLLHLRGDGKFDEPTYKFLKRRANAALAAQKQAEERADGAEKDARDAAELMREAFALKAKAEERAAGLAEAMRKMRSGGLVPTFWVQFADDAVAAYETALASQPADEQRLRHVLVGDRCKVCGVQFANGLAGTWCSGQPADERGEERKACLRCEGSGGVRMGSQSYLEQCSACKGTGSQPADERGEERKK